MLNWESYNDVKHTYVIKNNQDQILATLYLESIDKDNIISGELQIKDIISNNSICINIEEGDIKSFLTTAYLEVLGYYGSIKDKLIDKLHTVEMNLKILNI